MIIYAYIHIHIYILYCIVFIHFVSASHGMRLSEALPTTAIIDTVLEFTRRHAIGNCKSWRLEQDWVERHRLYQCAITPHILTYTHTNFDALCSLFIHVRTCRAYSFTYRQNAFIDVYIYTLGLYKHTWSTQL